MDPELFYEKMKQLAIDYDGQPGEMHSRMDELMCEALNALGYKKGLKVYSDSEMYYD